MTKLAVAATLALAFGLATVSFASAQGGPDVRILQLECDSDPELVVIQNLGDANQDFTGWQLQSDPGDVFGLAGGLLPGASITIQSGPSASGVFIWLTAEVFRDNDPTDYARIVDATGAVVFQVACAAGATPAPSPSPTPSPADVPNGGGPPPLSGGTLSSTMMLLLGGTIAAVGVATLAFPRLRLRPSPAARPRVQPVARQDSERRPLSPTTGLLILAFATVAFLLMGRRRG